MNRHMNQAQRGKQAFHAVRQRIRRRRERHDGRAHDQEAQADRHLQGKMYALAGNFKNPELNQYLPRRQQNIEDHGDEKKQQGQWNSAIAMYERFMKTYPSTDGAYQLYQLSNIYRDKANEENGEEKQATIRKMFEIYEEIENKYPRWENIPYVLYTHARWTYAYFDRDNSRSLARPYYEKLYDFLSAKDEQTEQEKAMIVEACQYLGSDSYFQHKNLADARVWWRRILLFDPENENAREALDKIKK